MTKDHLSIRGPEDILGFIPHTLGYWPSNSLVAMTMQGKRLGATLRVDLPPEHQADFGHYARAVGNYLEADEDADGALLIIFSNDGWDQVTGETRQGVPRLPETPTVAHSELLAAVEEVLESAGMPVRDVWLVGENFWRNADCTDDSCCPLPGRSLDEIRDSRLNAEMVFRGSSVGPGPDTPAGRMSQVKHGAPDPIMTAAQLAWAGTFARRTASRRQFDAVLGVWSAVLAEVPAPPPSPDVLGFLRASLCIPSWRDAVLVMAVAGVGAATQGAEDFGVFQSDGEEHGDDYSDDNPYGPDITGSLPAVTPAAGQGPMAKTALPCSGATVPNYGEVLLGLAPRLPNWTLMDRLEKLLVQLDEPSGGEASAAALTARGWIEWCRGRGSFAHSLLGQAIDVLPGYRLAELLNEVVQRGMVCGWAARREAAWQKIASEAA
jgi:hypothetical protein